MKKTKLMVFNARDPHYPFAAVVNGEPPADHVEEHKILGVTFDTGLTFSSHVADIEKRMLSRLRTLQLRITQKWGPSCKSCKILSQ